ncbi:MAG: hypothetical protein KDE53_27475 [Caldilineaceae bacterium]|nr:hypothetical protein [Caldilineaceae bacterium]
MAVALHQTARQVRAHLQQQYQSYRQQVRNRQVVQAHTKLPKLFLRQQITQLLGCDDTWLEETAVEYSACNAAWKLLSGLRSPSRRTDGFAKSLDVAEGFALWALVKHQRPQIVVELGSQYGISARLWKEALKAYVPGHELILCDLEDKRRFIDDTECTFLQGDARETLRTVFANSQVALLHNDAHPYDLIEWSLMEGLRQQIPIFTFHDVGGYQLRGGPFKPESGALPLAEKLQHSEEYGPHGTWERHLMAEVFDPRIITQDFVVTPTWRMQIFDSLFGFGAILRADLVQDQP